MYVEGHQNRITGSRVRKILRNGWILPIGGVKLGRQACLYAVQNLQLYLHTFFQGFGATKWFVSKEFAKFLLLIKSVVKL